MRPVATRRTQPMRRSIRRKQTPALKAATKGSPAYLRTAHEHRRAAMRKKRRTKKVRVRRLARPRDPLLALLAVRRRL